MKYTIFNFLRVLSVVAIFTIFAFPSSVSAAVPTVTLSASPSAVASGAASTITWSTTDATLCTGYGSWSGSKTTNGSQLMGNLTTNMSYVLVCTGPDGSASNFVNVDVNTVFNPSVALSSSPTTIAPNTASTLSWNTTNSTSCTGYGSWSGSKTLPSGSQPTGNLTISQNYILTCTGTQGTWSDNAYVSVSNDYTLYALDLTGGLVTITASGINCPGDCSQTYPSGTSVTITAAASSYDYGSWGGDCAGQGNPCTLLMNSDKIVSIGSFGDVIGSILGSAEQGYFFTFNPSVPIPGACGAGAGTTVATEPTGTSACSAGILTDSPADTGTNWNWTCTGLNGGASSPSCSANKLVGPAQCADGINNDTDTKIDTLDWGCHSDNNAVNAASYVPTDNTEANAYCAAWGPEQLVYRTGSIKDGIINLSDAAGWCDATIWGACPAGVPTGGPDSLSAKGSPFVCCRGIEDGDFGWIRECTGATYTLTTLINSGSGTLTASGISCPGDCSQSYASDTWQTVIATPSASYTFGSWSGACAEQISSCSIFMDGNKSTTANFIAIAPTATLSANPTSVAYGGASTLTWSSTNATFCTASGGAGGWAGTRVTDGTFPTSNLTTSQTYYITCTGLGGTSPLRSATVAVAAAPMTLAVSCSASPITALIGQTVTWTATVSDGTGPYTYSWSGTNIPTSPAPATNPYATSYSTIGRKEASVRVTDSTSAQATCNPAATVQIKFDPTFEEF